MGANKRIVAGSGNFVEIAAGTDESWGWTNPHPGDWIVEACYFHPMAALTAHASNNTALSVENGGTEIATITTTAGGSGSLTAHTGVAITLTGTGKNLEVSQGGNLTFKKTDGGSGVAASGQFCVALRRVRL